MDFNIKAAIEDLVKKISGDKGLLEKFTKDPVGAIKGLLGGRRPARRSARGSAGGPGVRRAGQAEAG